MPFQYQKRDPADAKARIRAHRFDVEFKKAIIEANQKNPKRQCELLRSNEPLSADHRAALADLINWHLQVRPTRGRPIGSPFPTQVHQLQREIINRARREHARLRKTADGKRLPKGTIDQLITKVVGQVVEAYDGEQDLNQVSLKHIRNAVTRGTKLRR